MTSRTIVVDARFCGPPQSGNGGYCAGLVAATLDGASEVTLHAPPPLDVPLTLDSDGATARLHRGGATIASGRTCELDLEPPPPPDRASAERASERYPGFETHPFATCFVCGPQRDPGDGLRIFSGPAGEVWAAPWTPDRSLSDDGRRINAAYVWAALDCPSYFALGRSGMTALLGRMTSRVDDVPRVEEPCVVVSWHIASEGRKHRAGAAVYGEDGRLMGVAVNVWIAVKGDL